MDHLHLRSLRTVTARRPPDRARRRGRSCSGRSTSRHSTRSLPATRHTPRGDSRNPRRHGESGACRPLQRAWPALATRRRAGRLHPRRRQPSGLLRRRHRPVRRDARLSADRRRPAPDLGLGTDARRPPPRPGTGRHRHALDRSEVRRPDPLGHVHADHARSAARRPGSRTRSHRSRRRWPSSTSPTGWSRSVPATR